MGVFDQLSPCHPSWMLAITRKHKMAAMAISSKMETLNRNQTPCKVRFDPHKVEFISGEVRFNQCKSRFNPDVVRFNPLQCNLI